MHALVLRSLLARPSRTALSAAAVLAAVALLSGVLVFIDTIDSTFGSLFAGRAAGAALVVSGRQGYGASPNSPASMPVSLVGRIAQLPGVAAAQGQLDDSATILTRAGRPIRTAVPGQALSYLPAPFTGTRVVAGRAPQGPGDVALDVGTARSQHYRVGDVVPIVTEQPAQRFRLTGLVQLGDVTSSDAPVAVFDLPTAQALYDRPGNVDTIYVALAPPALASNVAGEIRPLLAANPELTVGPPASQNEGQLRRLDAQLQPLKGGLLGVGIAAVLVAGLAILGAFALSVASRTRELALARALGATRGQVLRAVLLEAVAIGAPAAAAGVAAGLLGAIVIRAVLGGLGAALPATGLVVSGRTVGIGLGAGMLATVAAALVPALRATGVPPLAALRGAAAPRRAATRTRPVRLAAAIARSLIRLASAPLRPGRRLLGCLTREQALQDPRRVAAGALSLTVGVALVVLVDVYAASLHAVARQGVDRTLVADFTVESQDGASAIPAGAARAPAELPDLSAVTTLKTAAAHLGGRHAITAGGIDPTTISQGYRFDWVQGSDARLADLGLGDVLLERRAAQAAHLTVGDRTRIDAGTGRAATVTVTGIYDDPALMPGALLAAAQFDQLFHQPRLQDVFVRLAPGADRAASATALSRALAPFPGVVARSGRQLADQSSRRVREVLILFYALLAVAGLVGLVTIASTAALSVRERRRELGMLRAMGMTSAQAGTLVRQEGVIAALLGTGAGVLLGLLLAAIVTAVAGGESASFSLPWPQLVLVAAVGLASGVLAVLPASLRASRLDVMSAIAYE